MHLEERFNIPKDASHKEKYQAIVNGLGYQNVCRCITLTTDELKKGYQADEHFNSISLSKWDEMGGWGGYHSKGGRFFSLIGYNPLILLLKRNRITCFSPSDSVCILKECARMIVLEKLEKKEGKSKKP